MKTHHSRNRNVLILLIVCSLLTGYTVRDVVAGAGYEGPPNDAARLLIQRIPDLGHNVIVNMWIDGMTVPPIVYGHSSELFVPPGRHLVSLRPTPDPKWSTPSHMFFHVRRGETYNFVVMSDHSGHLILRPN